MFLLILFACIGTRLFLQWVVTTPYVTEVYLSIYKSISIFEYLSSFRCNESEFLNILKDLTAEKCKILLK